MLGAQMGRQSSCLPARPGKGAALPLSHSLPSSAFPGRSVSQTVLYPIPAAPFPAPLIIPALNPALCLVPSLRAPLGQPQPAPSTPGNAWAVNEWHSTLSSPSCAIRAVGMPSPTSPPIPPPLLGNSCPSLWQGGGEEAALCSYLSLRSRECGEELEIALADTDTCAEQQGPALAVVIAYCMAMSQPEPRSGSTRLPCLPHPAGKLMLPLPVLWKWGGGPKHRSRERGWGMRASCSFLSSRDAFKCQGGLCEL